MAGTYVASLPGPTKEKLSPGTHVPGVPEKCGALY